MNGEPASRPPTIDASPLGFPCAPAPSPIRPLVPCERSLALGGRRHRVLRARKGDEEGISLSVDLLAPGRRESLSQQALVLAEHRLIPLAQTLEELVEPSMSLNRKVTVARAGFVMCMVSPLAAHPLVTRAGR